jgi:asparagine synthase (glutamine-hydrolysing)
MKNKERTLIIDKINLTSKHEKVFDFQLVFPGSSTINFSNNFINIKLGKNENIGNFDIELALKESISKFKPDSVLVSGGIDSSVLAAMAVKEFNDVKLISAGTKDCEDSFYSKILSNELNAPLYSVIITEDNLINAIKELKSLGLDTYSIIMGLTEFLAIEKAKELKRTKIISGIGSDELFFGFQKHKSMKKEELEKFRESRLFYMSALDLWRLNLIALKFNVSIAFPYLDDRVIDSALSTDIEQLTENYDKFPIRSIGKSLGLSGKITERRKKAMQYGSGTVKLIRELSRKKKYKNVGEFIKEI